MTSSAGLCAPDKTAETEICLAQRRRIDGWIPRAREDDLSNELNEDCAHGEGNGKKGIKAAVEERVRRNAL